MVLETFQWQRRIIVTGGQKSMEVHWIFKYER